MFKGYSRHAENLPHDLPPGHQAADNGAPQAIAGLGQESVNKIKLQTKGVTTRFYRVSPNKKELTPFIGKAER